MRLETLVRLRAAGKKEPLKKKKHVWRRGWDSNPRGPFEPNGFQDRRFQPLTHPSGVEIL
jgi:hypothetical protein